MPKIESTLTGRIIEVLVRPGDPVTPGTAVLTIESMKMEIPLESELSGIVEKVLLNVGDPVAEGQAVVLIA